jgi:hypothetical protein
VRGRTLRLSAGRRFITDAMWLSARVPTVSAQRRMQLGTVATARAACAHRASWVALFTKAFAMVADECPELRRAYIRCPWPHLYEYPENAGIVMIERIHQGESVALPFRIRNPSWLPVAMLSEIVQNAKAAPIEEMTDFVRVIRISALPWPLRRLLWWIAYSFGRVRASFFGTFIVSVYSSMGADPLYGISPGTVLLTYGAVAADGGVDVRIMWDHRVLDGATIARALVRMEEVLCTTIAEELASSRAPATDN